MIVSTVCRDTPMICAIEVLLLPRAIQRSNSSSRGDKRPIGCSRACHKRAEPHMGKLAGDVQVQNLCIGRARPVGVEADTDQRIARLWPKDLTDQTIGKAEFSRSVQIGFLLFGQGG